MGRALAPIETTIANWRAFIAARQSIRRLSEALARGAARRATTTLPKPARSLVVEQATVATPRTGTPIVTGVHFSLKSGEALGILGPSGAGKSSLGRMLVGVWLPARGSVRLDGATLDQWDAELLGRHVGLVSQAGWLFSATISEKIAPMAAMTAYPSGLRRAKTAC